MRYMMLYKPGYETDTPPSEEEMATMGAFIEEMARTGKLIATDGLQHSAQGVRVRYEDGSFSVTDGPFAETKELVGGFAIMNVDSKDEAIELTKRFLQVARGGETEIRLMHGEAAYETNEYRTTAAV